MLTMYMVTTLADPGSGGALSLRQAITAANTAGGTNVIDFAGGLTGTIDLKAVLPTITCGLTIDGPGASLVTVNAHGYGSVLTFSPASGSPSSTIEGLTITGGSYLFGSGPLGGGGIDNSGDALVVSNCVIAGNSSTGVGGGIATGAMGNAGSLQVKNSTITGNTASSSGGGICAWYGNSIIVAGSVISGNTAGTTGGGIDGTNSFDVNVSGSTISGNTAVNGGGIYEYSTLIVTGSTITSNMAKGSSSSTGGGIDIDGGGPGTITNSTISGNSATEAGGGAYNAGTIVLIDSTISGNAAGAGGGLYDSAASTSVVNSTLTGNTATTTGGGIDHESGTLTITDSTISGNSAATSGGGVCSYITASDAGTINGTIVAANAGNDLTAKAGFFSGSNDLIGDGSDQGALMNTQRGSSTVLLNPFLSPLGNFGGPTQTMALLPGSVAIDNGANFPVLDSQKNNITATDQRGVARPQGLAPDIGAFESQNLPVGTSTQLAFGQQPGNSLAGIAVTPAIVVYILDSNGNLATTDNSMVTLAVATGPMGAITGGTAAVQAINGVATFTSLLVLTTMPGTVTLQATDGTLGTAASASFKVSLPYVPTTILAASTTVAANSRYTTGGSVPITVNFSAAVNVVGAPQLTLNDGAVVNYASGSGTSTLTFTYAVAAGQNTADLDYASTAALALNGGSIKDQAGNPVELTLPATGTDGLATKNLVIDTTAPTASTVSTTAAANSRYKAGGTVSIKITFSETVNVTGTPKLTLDDGAVVSYASGSGSSTLTFTYAVAAGQNTADLDYASTAALALNGGSIQDLAGNTAVLTLPATGTDGLATQNIVIDTTPPTVSAVSATAAANSRYKAGGTVSITITLSETVNVTGTPKLTLDDGAVVSYASGSGSSTLMFIYTVAAGQNTADLDYASTAALALNGGSIQDLAGNAAVLTLPATGSDGLATQNIVIDTTAPKISTVSTTAAANSRYTVGGTVPIILAFGEAINVSGTPQLALNDGAVVNYTSGSGSSTLTFTYSIAAGQNTADLNYASTAALALNGGSIQDLAGNAAVLTLPATGTDGLAAQKIVIDTTAPKVSTVSTTAAANSRYTVGGTVPITLTFGEAINVSGTPQLTLNDGAVVNYSSGNGSSTLTFTYTVAAGQNTTDLDYASTAALALNGGSIQDLAGNAAVLTLPATGTDGVARQNIVIDTATLAVTAAEWTSAGLTLTLGSDSNLHVFVTGTTPPADAVVARPPASVSNIEITSPSDTTASLTIDSTAGDPVPAGCLIYSGGGGLIITGSGSVTLSSTNSYTGGTDVCAGTLRINAASAIPTGGSLTVGAGATFLFDSSSSAASTVSNATTAATSSNKSVTTAAPVTTSPASPSLVLSVPTLAIASASGVVVAPSSVTAAVATAMPLAQSLATIEIRPIALPPAVPERQNVVRRTVGPGLLPSLQSALAAPSLAPAGDQSVWSSIAKSAAGDLAWLAKAANGSDDSDQQRKKDVAIVALEAVFAQYGR